MRITLPCFACLAACSGEANHIGNPLLLPFTGVATLAENTVYNARRAKVEVLVKSNHPALIAQITAGCGAILTLVMDTARNPANNRPARIIQLQSDIALYMQSPAVLVTALMVYGG